MMNKKLLIDNLRKDEGSVIQKGRHVLYADHLGNMTIGYGRLLEAKQGGGITELEAKLMLGVDIDRCQSEVSKEFSYYYAAPEPVQRGLVNMCFNLGLPRLKKFVKMHSALEAQDYQRAADEALDSKWARQVGRRAQRIADLFLLAERRYD